MQKIELIAARFPWLRNAVSVCQFVALLSLLLTARLLSPRHQPLTGYFSPWRSP